MTARSSLVAFALLALVGASQGMTVPTHGRDAVERDHESTQRQAVFRSTSVSSATALGFTLSDSALDELAAGRFWHAARIMWAEGAAEGSPLDVLTLARAEAGWENWPVVRQLLEDVDWLATLESGLGQYLFARALEQEKRWVEAAAGYELARRSAAPADRKGAVLLARGARSAWHAGDRDGALRSLNALRGTPHVRSWMAVELALLTAEVGDVDAVRALAGQAVEPSARGVLWRTEADALLAASDTAAAAEELASLLDGAPAPRRAEITVTLGRLALAAGDSARARSMLLDAFGEARGGSRVRAAEALVDLGEHELELTLDLAQLLDRSGDGRRALRAYDRAYRAAVASGAKISEGARLERARLMATVRDRQDEALEEFRALRDSTESDRIGARNLEVWAQMRSRQGRTSEVNTLRRWLLEEYPGSSEAAEVVWSRASDAEARGALDQALSHYAFLVEHVPTHSRAGEARMRSGQIHLRGSNRAAAAAVFEAYLEDFPNGRRWQEAAYWAGRTRLELGDTAVAERHLRHVLTQPIEYYAVMAADLLGVPFDVALPAGEGPVEPGWLTEGLVRLDLLTDAGLERGAEAEITRLRSRAGATRGPRLRLAAALIERGRTIDGINLGWALLEDKVAWDREILRVTYPFPYRELVRREAAEWGVDPFMMAAIIRQESAFKADIVSRAGAIGLMQVMPPTGAQLARAHGPNGFTEASLTKPEVNLHLGAAFFVDMSRRYDNELPLVLSAYNAGPTRATRWRRYPEASDPLRFTERIPFTETRGYVKNVRRNLGLYRVLYGQD